MKNVKSKKKKNEEQKPQKKGKKEPVGNLRATPPTTHYHKRHLSSRQNNVGKNEQQRETRRCLRVVRFLVVCPFARFFFFGVRLFVCLGDEDAKKVRLARFLSAEKNTSADLLRA